MSPFPPPAPPLETLPHFRLARTLRYYAQQDRAERLLFSTWSIVLGLGYTAVGGLLVAQGVAPSSGGTAIVAPGTVLIGMGVVLATSGVVARFAPTRFERLDAGLERDLTRLRLPPEVAMANAERAWQEEANKQRQSRLIGGILSLVSAGLAAVPGVLALTLPQSTTGLSPGVATSIGILLLTSAAGLSGLGVYGLLIDSAIERGLRAYRLAAGRPDPDFRPELSFVPLPDGAMIGLHSTL